MLRPTKPDPTIYITVSINPTEPPTTDFKFQYLDIGQQAENIKIAEIDTEFENINDQISYLYTTTNACCSALFDDDSYSKIDFKLNLKSPDGCKTIFELEDTVYNYTLEKRFKTFKEQTKKYLGIEEKNNCRCTII